MNRINLWTRRINGLSTNPNVSRSPAFAAFQFDRCREPVVGEIAIAYDTELMPATRIDEYAMFFEEDSKSSLAGSSSYAAT